MFREFGPLAGSTMRLGLRRLAAYRRDLVAPEPRRRRALLPEAGKHRRARAPGARHSRASATRLITSTSAATRRCAGYDYLQFVGQNVFFGNAELRFPIIEAALTPIGVIGGIRGVFFANMRRRLVQQHRLQVLFAGSRDRHGDHRLSADPGRVRHADLKEPAPDSRIPPARWRARHAVLGSRPSRSASRFTSTGRGERSSTANGKTRFYFGQAARTSSASRASRSGSATTSRDDSSESTG